MSLVPFFLAATVLAMTPGPGMAYVVARTVAGGRQEGLASCLGTGLGGLLHVVAAALGLSLIVAQSALAFDVIKTLGAVFLIYLGLRMLWRKNVLHTQPVVTAQGTRRALMEGIVVEALNVKTALFFLAFLPQFTDPHRPVGGQLMMLGSICVTLNTLVDVAAVFGAQRFLTSRTARVARAHLLRRVSGVTMAGLGVALAMTRKD